MHGGTSRNSVGRKVSFSLARAVKNVTFDNDIQAALFLVGLHSDEELRKDVGRKVLLQYLTIAATQKHDFNPVFLSSGKKKDLVKFPR